MKVNLICYVLMFASQLYANDLVTPSKCVAHRGNSKFYLENSTAAIKSAVELGVDGIELDVRHTFDGYPILLHDRTLSRVAKSRDGFRCPLNKNVNDLYFFTIRMNCVLKNGEEIPYLKNILELIPLEKIELYFELKDSPSDNSIALIGSYLSQMKKANFISFNSNFLARTSRLLERQNVTNNRVNFYKVYLIYLFHRHEYNVDVLYNSINFKRLVNSENDVLSGIWTVDDEDTMQLAFKNGINFITTNNPGLCLMLKDQE